MEKKWIFILIPIAVLIAIFAFRQQTPSGPAEKLNTKTLPTTPTPSSATVTKEDLPIPRNHPLVQSVTDSPNPGFLQYFFSGSIGQIKTVNGGTQIILVGDDGKIPPLVVPANTKITKFTQKPKSLQMLPLSALKPGLIVDVRMDYQFYGTRWLFREVFLPTDRNPQLR